MQSGSWLGEDGELITRCGDVVLVGGREEPPGRIGDYICPASERARRPDPDPAPAGGEGPGAKLKARFDTWNWVRPEIGPTLLLGWVVAAIAGGAPPWRPLMWITGEAGTGKSTPLGDVLDPVFGGGLVHASDATAAGIWQKIQYASLPIAVDVAEAKEDPRRPQAVIELARQAASGGPARLRRSCRKRWCRSARRLSMSGWLGRMAQAAVFDGLMSRSSVIGANFSRVTSAIAVCKRLSDDGFIGTATSRHRRQPTRRPGSRQAKATPSPTGRS